MLRTTATLLLAFSLSGCVAHLAKPKPADLPALRQAAENFHKLVRWNDLRGAAQMIAEERRMDFLKMTINEKDDELLKVIEYDIEDAQVKPETATVIAKVIWHRLPSVTTKTEAITTEWEARGSTWFIVSIDGGPLPLAKSAAPAPAATAPDSP